MFNFLINEKKIRYFLNDLILIKVIFFEKMILIKIKIITNFIILNCSKEDIIIFYIIIVKIIYIINKNLFYEIKIDINI